MSYEQSICYWYNLNMRVKQEGG